ncbi:MAG: O-antigen ligase family protein [Acidobacteria bacterium]|nr:O-antigen ligase family protein [Acidobacteriota bacterium]
MTAGTSMVSANAPSWAQCLAIACVAGLPVVMWPGLQAPFSAPKLALLAVGALAVAVATRRDGAVAVSSSLRVLAAAWAVTFIVSAAWADLYAFDTTLLGLASVAFAIAVARSGVPAHRLQQAQTLGVTGVALVALLQWGGLDPFALIGWHAPIAGASVRMRVYATMGNPNFVGALMAMSVGLAGAVALGATTVSARVLALAAAGLQAGALLVTGSRGAVLGLACGALAWAFVRWSGRAVAALLLILGFGVAAIAISPARPLETTIAGRVYLWRVVAPHATQRWLTGLGPGVFELRFPEWQRAAAARGQRDARFLGLTDHAHNDYLEALVERGVPGLLALVGALGCACRTARTLPRPVPPVVAAALASIVAGAACAIVDFPLARPVELAWWWLALVIILARHPAFPSRHRQLMRV